MKEAGINAKQAGERGISAKSVRKVTEVSTGMLQLIIQFTEHLIDVLIEIQGLSYTRKLGVE